MKVDLVKVIRDVIDTADALDGEYPASMITRMHNRHDKAMDALRSALSSIEQCAQAYYTAPIDSVTHKPGVVTYRGGHPSEGVHVGPNALEQAREHAARSGMRVFALIEVEP